MSTDPGEVTPVVVGSKNIMTRWKVLVTVLPLMCVCGASGCVKYKQIKYHINRPDIFRRYKCEPVPCEKGSKTLCILSGVSIDDVRWKAAALNRGATHVHVIRDNPNDVMAEVWKCSDAAGGITDGD